MVQSDSAHLDDAAHSAFRRHARSWMREHLPARDPHEPILSWDDPEIAAKDRRIQRALFDGGLAGLTLPEAYGGRGLDASYERVLWDEAQLYRLPWSFGVAFNVIVPTLMAHGSEHLKRRYIPAILRGEEIWCQLLSEPSGGSDLAGLLTRATRSSDGWRLNGSKVWTTGGNAADMAICLARTDPEAPKHGGLTMFVVGMRAPGVSITPLKLINGEMHFCQEFLDDVVIADAEVVGPVNGGWTVATTLMVNERAGVGRGWHIGLARASSAPHFEFPSDLRNLISDAGRADDLVARQLIGEAWVLDIVQALTTRRVAAGMRAGVMTGAAAALSKLMGGRASERRSGLLSELAGAEGIAAPEGADGPREGMARVITHSIGGGTKEMQSNAVAERLLGLPREPGFDPDLPFNQLRHNESPSRPRSS